MMTAVRSALGLCALVLTLAMIPVPAIAGDQVIGSPGISVYSPDNEFVPGQEASLPIYVSNNGRLRRGGPAPHVDRVTTARGMTIDVLDGGSPIEVNTGRYPVGRVPEGTQGPIPIAITIPEDAPSGTYEIPVRVRYSYTSLVDYSSTTPEYNDAFRNRVHTLEITIRDTPRFKITNTSSTARVNGQGNTSVTVRNVGTEPATDATLQFTSPSEEIRLGTPSQRSRGFAFVNTWEPGESHTFEFTTSVTDDAVSREYPLTSIVSYEDPDGIPRTSENATAGITPGAEQTFAVEDVSGSLYVGEPGSISGTVINTGPTTIDSAVLVFSPENPTIDPVDTTVSLGRLEPGESDSFSYDLDVAKRASAGDRRMNLTVRYRDPHDDRRVSDPIEPVVSISPERTWLSVTPEEATFEIDTDNRMTVRIQHTERVSLRDLQLRLTTDDPFSTESGLAYIEQLDPGDTETAAFEVTVDEDAVATQSSVTLNVTAERPDGEEIVVDTYVIPVTVREDTGADDTTILLAGVFLVLVVLLAGWWWLRW